MSNWTRRRSSTSATRTIHEHNHEILRSPARLIAAAARPACAERGGDLPDGVGAPSATTTAGSGQRRGLLLSGDPRGSLRRASTWHQPRLHGSGAARQCRPAPRVMWRRHHEDGMRSSSRERGPDDGASPQPDPLGHLSSRNRGSTGWRARCCATPTCAFRGALVGASPTIPPHEPCGSRKRERKRKRQREARRARVAPAWPAFAKPADRTRRRPSACAERSRLPGSDEDRSACAVPTNIRGRGPLHPILREEDRDPQAPEVPSIDGPPCPNCAGSRRRRSGSRGVAELSLRLPRRAGVLPRLLPACGQHAARLTTVRLSNDLDGSFGAEARSP